jgi:hypothetical protein
MRNCCVITSWALGISSDLTCSDRPLRPIRTRVAIYTAHNSLRKLGLGRLMMLRLVLSHGPPKDRNWDVAVPHALGAATIAFKAPLVSSRTKVRTRAR